MASTPPSPSPSTSTFTTATDSETPMKTGLEGFPPEVMAAVCSFLRPADIVSLSNVSTTLQRGTQQKAIWRTALSRVCEQNGIFTPSFPVETMSLVELQAAATSMDRFKAEVEVDLEEDLVQQHPITPYHTRVLHFQETSGRPGKRRAFNGGLPVDRVVVVPGGRFLLTSGSNAVALWDMGCPAATEGGKRQTPVQVVEKSALGEMSQSLAAVSPTPDGKGLLIAVAGTSLNPGGPGEVGEVSVWHIEDPTASKEKSPWKRVVHLKIDHPSMISSSPPKSFESVCLHWDRLVVNCRRYLVYCSWSWKDGKPVLVKGCKWRHSSNYCKQASTMLMGRESLIGFHAVTQSMHVWDLPEATEEIAAPEASKLPTVDNEAKMSIPRPAKSGHLNPDVQSTVAKVIGLSPWQRLNSSSDDCFLVFYETTTQDDEGNARYHPPSVHRYALRRSSDPFLPREIPIIAGKREFPDYAFWDEATSCAAWNTSSLSAFGRGKFAFCKVTPLGSLVLSILDRPTRGSSEGFELVKRRLTEVGARVSPGRLPTYALCPMSGRLVVLLEGGCSVVISDLVASPEDGTD